MTRASTLAAWSVQPRYHRLSAVSVNKEPKPGKAVLPTFSLLEGFHK
jgi:hypothetical protein